LNPSRRTASVALLVVLTAGLPARAADPAELFPADTLLYAEVHKPAEVGPNIASVVKGSILADGIPFIHDRKDRAKNLRDINGKPELALLALAASPELLAEFGKLGGLAGGLLGFSERGEPELALAVLTGDSPAAGAAARAFLTLTPNLRRVGVVGNVPVFQYRTVSITYDNFGRPQPQNDKPPTDGPHEPTFAYTPGLFVVGTNKAAVAVVLARFTGTAKAEGSLAATPAFKSAAAAHRQPGVFFFANVTEFGAKLDAANKSRGEMPGSDLSAWFQLAVNLKAVRTLAGSLRFRDDGLTATVSATLDATQKSPVLEFLGGSGAKVEWLHHAPKPAVFAATVALPEKNRAAAVVGFLDALAKAEGEIGRLPGEAVKELEAKLKVPIADGLLGKTRAVTLVMPTKQELPKGVRPLPMLAFHTEGAEVAAAWEAFMPKLVGELSGAEAAPEPASETIGGVKVLSLAGTGLPWKAALHYARKGSVFVVGLDRKIVAAAVAGEPGASVVGAAGVTEPPEGTALFGTLSPGDVLQLLSERPKPEGPVVPVPGARPRRNDNGQFELEKEQEDETKGLKDFLSAFAALPPMTVTVRRLDGELRLELWQPKVQNGGLTQVINAGVVWADKLLNRYADTSGNIRTFGGFR
jgi:hypothetical protein